MEKPLVSIITPCFNGETFIHRFLDSVLDQTYESLELILVNDGSTDKTEEIVLSYQPRFEQRQIRFTYISQQNRGQAAAINQGLKRFSGSFLVWPDSDDILHKDNIRKKVEFLQSNPQFGLVLCKSRIVREEDLQPVGVLKRVPPVGEDRLFEDLILERNVYFAPGGYMLRTEAFLQVNPERTIYEGTAGQNWQMLLPVSYHYPCGYIDAFLYDYVLRQGSHSRRETTEADLIRKLASHEDTLVNVISQMGIQDEQVYLQMISKKYMRLRLHIACRFGNKEKIKTYFHELQARGWLEGADRRQYLIWRLPLFKVAIKVARRLVAHLRIRSGHAPDPTL